MPCWSESVIGGGSSEFYDPGSLKAATGALKPWRPPLGALPFCRSWRQRPHIHPQGYSRADFQPEQPDRLALRHYVIGTPRTVTHRKLERSGLYRSAKFNSRHRSVGYRHSKAQAKTTANHCSTGEEPQALM